MARGDGLEVERQLAGSAIAYTHHGIDLGDGTVAHARPWDFSNPFGGGAVVRTSWSEFAAGRTVRIVPFRAARFSAAEIATRAASQVGRPGYCPLVQNCEHFATWCANGESTSRQIDILARRVRSAATRTAAAVSARLAAGTAGRLAIRTAVGATVRLGLKSLVPAALVSEAAALAVEWRAHQAGCDEAVSRRAGDRAGLAASAAACAVAGAPAGPVGIIAGACAGMTIWACGSQVAAAASGAVGSVLGKASPGRASPGRPGR
ncbi:MAG: hypothetical protein RLZZ440_577 [Planctomycetota bacterium]|jgi:hypothetical protein